MLRHVFSTFAVLSVLAGPLQAQDPQVEALAEEVLLLNGFDTLTEDQVRGFASAPDSMMEDDLATALAWERLGPRFFKADVLFDATVTQLAESASAAQLTVLKDFFAGDLGLRVTALEEASQAPEMDDVDKVTLGRDLLEQQPDMERIAALERLGAAFTTPEEIAASSLNTQFIFQSELNRAMGNAIPDGDLLALLINRQGDMIDNMRTESVARHAFIYQTLNVTEINAYAEIIESEAGQAMYDAVLDAMEAELHNQIRAFAAALGAAIAAENI